MPIAVAGLKPKMKTRIGVMSEPPPMPVMPTSTPIARPGEDELPGHRSPALLEHGDDAVGRFLDPERRHVEVHVGALGRLVRPAGAGEVAEAARARLRVQALRVALGRELERDVDEHLDELALAEARARRRAVGPERRHERGDHDEPRVGHELRHLGGAPVVLGAVGVAEAEILREPVAEVVAVEHERVPAERVQPPLDRVRDRRLARAREAGEPHDERLLALRRGARGAVDLERLPRDVVRAAQRELQQAGADRVVRDAVDEDEAARVAVLRVRVEGDRLAQLDVDDADRVQLEMVRGDAVERVDVELVLDRRDRGRDRLRRRRA